MMEKSPMSLKNYIATFFITIIIIVVVSNILYFVMWGLSIKKEVELRIKNDLKNYAYFITLLADKLKDRFAYKIEKADYSEIEKRFGNVSSGYYSDIKGNFVYIEKLPNNIFRVYYLDPDKFVKYILGKLNLYTIYDTKPRGKVYVELNIYGKVFYLGYSNISFSRSKQMIIFQIVQMVIILSIFAKFFSYKMRSVVLKPFNEFSNAVENLLKEGYHYIPSDKCYFREIEEIRLRLNEAFSKMSEEFENMKAKIQDMENMEKAMISAVEIAKDAMAIEDIKKFLKEIIKLSVKVMPNADAGSFYIVKDDGHSQFLTSYGYDEKYLKGLKLVSYKSKHAIIVKWKLTENLFHFSQEVKKLLSLAGSDRISSSLFVPVIVRENIVGELWIDSFKSDKFRKDEIELAEFFSALIAIFMMQSNVRKDIHSSIIRMIKKVISEIEIGKPYTEKGHTESVIKHSVGIAKFLGLDEDEIEVIRKSAAVHDVGKALIPTSIFFTKSVSPEIYEVIKDHPHYTKKILSLINISPDIVECAYHHHERFDGKGYPEGLSGENIPLCSRILAVADAFDDMTRKKIIGTSLSKEEGLRKLKQGSGTIWDPKVVEAALKYFTGAESV